MFEIKKLKKVYSFLVILVCSVIFLSCSRGSVSSTETSSAGSTDSIYWQNFANDDGASYSTSNSLPTGFSVGSAQLNDGATSYSSPLVYLDDDGTQYLIILEIDGNNNLYLNKYAYSGSSVTYDETLATFDADDSNFEHHQIAMFISNNFPMIVVGHADGVDIVNASSADESDGEVSTTVTGAAYRVLVDSSDTIYVQAENGVYKFDSALNIEASNTSVTSTTFSNRLPMVFFDSTLYLEVNNAVHSFSSSTLTSGTSTDYDFDISDVLAGLTYTSGDQPYENDDVELLGTRIGMMAEISVDGTKKLIVAVIREIRVEKYSVTDTFAGKYTGFVSTSYYYHGETDQIEDFLGDPDLAKDSDYYNYFGNYQDVAQTNAVGHSSRTAISVSNGSIYLPLNNLDAKDGIYDDQFWRTDPDYTVSISDIDETPAKNAIQLTLGSSASTISSSSFVFPLFDVDGNDNDGDCEDDCFVYATASDKNYLAYYQVPTFLLSDNEGNVFGVFSYDTQYIDSEFNDPDHSAYYAEAIDSSGGTIDDSMTNTTIFLSNDNTSGSITDTVEVSVISAGNGVVFAVGDDGNIYIVN